MHGVSSITAAPATSPPTTAHAASRRECDAANSPKTASADIANPVRLPLKNCDANINTSSPYHPNSRQSSRSPRAVAVKNITHGASSDNPIPHCVSL